MGYQSAGLYYIVFRRMISLILKVAFQLNALCKTHSINKTAHHVVQICARSWTRLRIVTADVWTLQYPFIFVLGSSYCCYFIHIIIILYELGRDIWFYSMQVYPLKKYKMNRGFTILKLFFSIPCMKFATSETLVS